MVDMPDDSMGKSTFIRGAEERIWSKVVDKFDLVDAYLVASQRRGPIYTRQKHCGLRFNQSRLDRIYSSNIGVWFQHISEMDHDGRETLLDHIPIVATLISKEDVRPGLRKDTYLKMDYRWLGEEDFFIKVKTEWENGKKQGEDPRVTWDMGWRRIRTLMKEEKHCRAIVVPSKELLEQEL